MEVEGFTVQIGRHYSGDSIGQFLPIAGPGVESYSMAELRLIAALYGRL